MQHVSSALQEQNLAISSSNVRIYTFNLSGEAFSELDVCSFKRGHQVPQSTGRRDFTIYTAGWTGAMRVRFLAQGNNSNSNSRNWISNRGHCNHQANAQITVPYYLMPGTCICLINVLKDLEDKNLFLSLEVCIQPSTSAPSCSS